MSSYGTLALAVHWVWRPVRSVDVGGWFEDACAQPLPRRPARLPIHARGRHDHVMQVSAGAANLACRGVLASPIPFLRQRSAAPFCTLGINVITTCIESHKKG
jgi:hypothetical protein